MNNTPIMKIEGLGISFGGLKAVDDVSFDVDRNQVKTVIGPNGAGKSTLFNLISGAIAPTQRARADRWRSSERKVGRTDQGARIVAIFSNHESLF